MITVASDGSGGFYVGGSFARVGAFARSNLAHILANGSVDPAFAPNPNGQIDALAVSDSAVYAGGVFTSIGGRARHRIAALDASTGDATSWSPNANDAVDAFAVSGSTVYAGGRFTSIGGQIRSRIAALDASTGDATSWNPRVGGADYPNVRALAVSGSTVYAGGYFTSIGGQARSGLAALDASTGDATSWNPNPSGGGAGVSALAISGSTVYAGGDFTSIGGQARNDLAALDASTGNATGWNPAPGGTNAYVEALAVSGSIVYAAGYFTSIGGQARNYIAALDAGTGMATSWNPDANGWVFGSWAYALAVSGSTIYAGGVFDSVGGKARNDVASLNATTGIATGWNPNPNDRVTALDVSGSTVYVGGYFTSIGGQARQYLAAVDATTGQATGWNPSPAGGHFPIVDSIAVAGSTVYVGGGFTSIGGQARNHIAAIDANTGEATSWNPGAGPGLAGVDALVVSGSTVYAGGSFGTIGSEPRPHLAAIDADTGDPTAWRPRPNHDVLAVAVSGSTVYAGGRFTSIGRQTRNHIAAIDANTGKPTSWNPDAGGTYYPNIRALAVSGSTVYAGGDFTSIGGQPRNYIAALDASSGDATSWTPDADYDVLSLALGSDGSLWAGGSFRGFATVPQPGIARFTPTP